MPYVSVVGVDKVDKSLFRKLVERTIGNVTEEDLDGVTIIAANSFYSCVGLSKIIIPSTVTAIKQSAFRNCPLSKGCVILSATPPSLENVNAFSNISSSGKIYAKFYGTTATNWVSISSRLFPLVDTVADLANIDTTAYTKACVIGVDETYKEYTYDGSQWNEVV